MEIDVKNQEEKAKSFIELIDEMKARVKKDKVEQPDLLNELVKSTIKDRPLSYSSLKQFSKSPQHYIDYITKVRTPPTPAMFLGSLLDVMLLSPKDFEETYFISPIFKHDGRTKLGKEERAKAREDAGDKICIDWDTYQTGLKMLESLYRDSDAMHYIDRIQYSQSSIIWTDPNTKLKSISKLDAEGDKGEVTDFIMDLKSATDAEESKFIRDAHNFGYHIQAGGYTLAMKRKFFRFPDYINVVVESKPPYAVNVFKGSNKYIETSQNEYEYLLLAFNMCLKENLWHLGHSFWRLGTPYYQMNLPGHFKTKLGY